MGFVLGGAHNAGLSGRCGVSKRSAIKSIVTISLNFGKLMAACLAPEVTSRLSEFLTAYFVLNIFLK